jgi:hypothetical protein
MARRTVHDLHGREGVTMRTLITAAAALVACAAITCTAPPARAATITVDWAGSGDYTSIGEGLAAGSPGDTILVLPGTYGGPENNELSFGGKDMVLRSADGLGSVAIDHYSQFAPVFHIHDGETRGAVVDGFTVSGASAWCTIPVLDIHDASPTIRNCRFSGNRAAGGHHTEGWCGVGSFYRSGGALIDCVMQSNSAHCGIGALGIVESSVDIENCSFVHSWDEWEGVGALYIRDSGPVAITGCLFVRNMGQESCIYASGSSSLTIENCTFVDNGGSYWGVETSGAVIGSYGPAPILVRDCIFAFNRIDGIMADPDHATVAWCCVYGNACGDTLTGNYVPDRIIWEDPLFCNWEAGDYMLCSDSPCLPSASGWGAVVGAYDEGCGACGSAVETISWGRIKAMYR